jgi:uncharacterized membrane protein
MMKSLLTVALFLGLSAGAALAEVSMPTPGSFFVIRPPDDRTITRITVEGVSGDGSTVVGSANFPDGSQAFRWTREAGFEALGVPHEGGWTVATAASWDGSVVVGRAHWNVGSSSRSEAFRWTRESGLAGLGDFDPDEPRSGAYGVSDDGRRVVGYATDLNQEMDRSVAFMWTAGFGMAALAHLPESEPTATAIALSSDGTAVVGTGGSRYYPKAFLWRFGVGIRHFGIGRARDISRDGSILVGSLGNGGLNEPFLWSAASGLVELGGLPNGNERGSALAVSGDGSVVVGEARSPIGDQAFLWTEADGMRRLVDVLDDYDLAPPDWILQTAVDVSADGRTIVGHGFDAAGSPGPFIAVLPDPLDVDADGVPLSDDNCPETPNAEQLDTDGDWVGDACDNCPGSPNASQDDLDQDEIGDVCDPFPADADNEFVQCQVDRELAANALETCNDDLAATQFELEVMQAAFTQCRDELASCEDALTHLRADSDGDGVLDLVDECDDTAPGDTVGALGCSLAQFCDGLEGLIACWLGDWRNDEPVGSPRDCAPTMTGCEPRAASGDWPWR